MVSVDGGCSPADDRDRDGKPSRQCLSAEVDAIDGKAIAWDLRDGSTVVMVNYYIGVRQELS